MNALAERAPARPAPPIAQIGPYQLLERLGSGGMGEVWLARRATSCGEASKIVAVKLMSSSSVSSTDALRLFKSEARLSMMLSHSNIVQMFDVGSERGRWFMAMEWVDGVDLSTVLHTLRSEGRPLDIGVSAYVLGELLNGLSYAHELREQGVVEAVVHRDISPHNVLTSVSGEVKITDFGIARLRSEETSGIHIRGKLRYMAPEQVAGDSRRPTVDLFAVGAVFHELLSGQSFRAHIPSEQLFGAAASGLVPPLERDDIPRPLRNLTYGLLQPNPSARIPSAKAALELLRAWPGYRNHRGPLSELVRKISGIEGPRSGLSIVGSQPAISANSPAANSPAANSPATNSDGNNPQWPAPVPLNLYPSQPSVGPIATIDSEAKTRSSETPLPVVATATQLHQLQARRAWPVVLVTLASVFTLFLAGLLGLILARELLTRDQPGQASTAPATADPAELPAPPVLEPAEAAEPEPIQAVLQPKPTPAKSTPTKPTRKTSLPTRTLAKSPSPQPREQRPAPAPITFTTGEFHWLTIQVAGKTLTLDPQATIDLPPGRHPVKIQTDGDWQPAGHLDLEPNQAYQVDFLLPAKLRQKRR